MKRTKLITLLFIFIFLSACQEEFSPIYDVPEEIQPYVDRFVEEGAKRGFDYQIDNLIIQFDETIGTGICGICNSNSQMDDIQKLIRINPNCNYSFDQQFEALIFHELGHCVLGREHDENLLPNGDPKSIMVANNISIYSICVYAVDNQPCNATFKRDYYLDELFDANTPAPDWAQ